MSVLETDGRDGLPDGFLELPARVYADDPMWIPEVPEAVARQFSADNAWFERNRARAFCVAGAARAVAFVDPSCVVDGERAAFFGFWESAGDDAADAAVMARVEQWAREQGAERLYGPIDFTTYGNYRVLLSAEEGAVPFPGEPYDPPGYPGRLEALGFALHMKYESHIGPMPEPGKVMLLAFLDNMRRAGYRFESLTAELWMSHLREIHVLVDDIFGDNFAYTPLSFEAFRAAAGEALVRKACPLASVIAWGPEGDIAGILLSYPHYGPLVTQGAGAERVPLSALSYAEHMPRLRALGPVDGLMKTVGTHPTHRRRGIQTALGAAALEASGDTYARWIAPLIRHGNPSGKVSEPFAQHKRYYGLYSKPL